MNARTSAHNSAGSGAGSGAGSSVRTGARTIQGQKNLQDIRQSSKDGIGGSPLRPDGTLKVRGEFAYSSDMWHEDMLWGMALRSPHPRANILSVDISEALTVPGVYAVLTHEDIPGAKYYGLEIADQPALAIDRIRYHGESIALVAADHPETARRALKKIKVEYEVLTPIVTEEQCLDPETHGYVHEPHEYKSHAHGNICHEQKLVSGLGVTDEVRALADVVVSGTYEVGMQDQAFLGPESGLAVPAEDGGIDLYIATQWLHVDRQQMAPVLGLPEEKVRLTLAGVGGAFGGREDLSMQIHACLLAQRTGKPVKIVYSRDESFFGHVHRHPAKMYYEHGATRDGKLVYADARIVLDGGAYASASPAVVGNAASLGHGPYVIPNVRMHAIALYSNNPSCGAMRGFGAVQAAFGYETQMDRLAAELDMDPVELRRLNAMKQGDRMPTGQEIDAPAPVAELLRRVKDMPLPPPLDTDDLDVRLLPGALSNTSHGEGIVRGVGYSVGIKNVGFSEGFDDYSTARVRLEVIGGEPVALVHTAMAEVGQGGVTVHAQIARTELGVEQVTIQPANTEVGSAGSTSASRQTYMTGGAVKLAAEAVKRELIEKGRRRYGWTQQDLTLAGGKVVSESAGALVSMVDLLGEDAIDLTREHHHRPTVPFDKETGQGFGHVQYTFCANRAVVDVDVELGLVKVVELTAVQDVGKALNPLSVVGQIQGGCTQALGLAVMEEIIVRDGKVRNASFTDYLIPTILDTPPIPVEILELPDPHAPYGLRGVGEAPTVSATPSIVAAIRNATGLALRRIPVRPEHLTTERPGEL
ncbi:xanthine dehydrogenase subunit D [Kitasatospora purpeofusca]|uniref:xanthine dehydrogenase subunit D n=1 Tax=Kitasatospora purpeofusca TaxID=67352 RepID=UPI002A59C143|nr:xanthine dehydrogenase subunit D [Kitasatospora purpeofusca]MDY0815941.1 xanthine dehydrogenase subunit D [Kitasatospora purpeofusca]